MEKFERIKKEVLRALTKKRDLFPLSQKRKTRPSSVSGLQRSFVPAVVFSAFLASVLGFLAGVLIVTRFQPSFLREGVEKNFLPGSEREETPVSLSLPAYSSGWEEAVVRAVDKASPAVVSIVVTKDVAVMEKEYYNPFEEFFGEEFDLRVPKYEQKGKRKQEVGGGTGFMVSREGLIITNKHVVADKKADYTVFTNRGKKYEARVLDRDPLQDIALLKIEASGLPVVDLANRELEMGQTVIAIGNVLGEFRNSVSVGVVSGLKRNITAVGGGFSETLRGIIQTDAAINQGNSGGPLLNLQGEVVGINTAMAMGAENVGFAIPIERAKRDIERLNEFGEIVYAFLGIYYTTVTPALQKEFDLPVDHGAWVGRDGRGRKTQKAIFSGSPAQKAGLKRGDIIVRFDGNKIGLKNTLADIIVDYSPGDTVTLEILRKGKPITKTVTLSPRE